MHIVALSDVQSKGHLSQHQWAFWRQHGLRRPAVGRVALALGLDKASWEAEKV